MRSLLNDEELIREYRLTGQDNHFQSLYERYVGKVYRRCLSLTKDADQAEDFTQDIFLKVFTKLDRFEERSRFSTWLYSIAHNYCMDQLRSGKRLRVVSLEEEVTNEVADTDSDRLHEEALQRVNRAMDSLSPEETTLLRLKYEDQQSIETIAQQYGLTVSAVKMRLKRSRDKIEAFCRQPYLNP